MDGEGNYIQIFFSRKLLSHHPSMDWSSGHSAVKAFMEEHGFEERKYSDVYSYVSKEEMTFERANKILDKLTGREPWILNCAEKIPVNSIVGRPVSYLDVIRRKKAEEHS